VVVGDVRGTLFGVLAAVVCVLLLACANVAHLQLMRNAARTREFAIRTALGGTRGRLLRQSLVEGGVVAAAAGLLGLGLAQAGVRVLLALAPSGIPRLEAVRVDGMVLAFAAGVSVLAAVLFGMLPALFVGRGDVQATLRDGAPGTGEGRQRVRIRSLLVISEFAMALVLLTTAGLVVRTMNAMLAIDAGYDPRNVISMRVSLRGTEDTSALRRAVFFREAIARTAALPGVDAASAVNHLPLHGDQWRFPYAVDGASPLREGERLSATFRIVRPEYFRVMRIPLLEGRELRAEDEASAARVVIINETMARRRWPDGRALGQRITVDDVAQPDWFTVIGVAREVRQGSWTEPSSEEMYFPQLATMAPPSTPRRLIDFLNPVSMTLVVRTAGDPTSIIAPVGEVIRSLNPNAAVSDIITMPQAVAEQFAVPRFYLTLFGIFATVAVVLALVGVYGVLSYSVTRRSRELGLRLALGASRSDPFRLVIGQGLRLVLWGTVAGVLASLVLTQLLRGLLFGVKPADPITFIVASLVLASVAMLGCIVPAWRAATLNPIIALRAE
jgi:putative ABC transport system permease protein